MWSTHWLSFSFDDLELMRLCLSSIAQREIKYVPMSETFLTLDAFPNRYVSIVKKTNTEGWCLDISGKGLEPGQGGFALGEKIFELYFEKNRKIEIARVDTNKDWVNKRLIEVVPEDAWKKKLLRAKTELQTWKADNAESTNSARLVQKNAKIRFYEKHFEIRHREESGKRLSAFDIEVLEKYEHLTRGEFEIRKPLTGYATKLFKNRDYKDENEFCEKVTARFLKKSGTEAGKEAFDTIIGNVDVELREASDPTRKKVRRDDFDDYSRTVKLLRKKARRWGFVGEASRLNLLGMLLVALELDQTPTELWVTGIPTFEQLLQRYVQETELIEEFKRLKGRPAR